MLIFCQILVVFGRFLLIGTDLQTALSQRILGWTLATLATHSEARNVKGCPWIYSNAKVIKSVVCVILFLPVLLSCILAARLVWREFKSKHLPRCCVVNSFLIRKSNSKSHFTNKFTRLPSKNPFTRPTSDSALPRSAAAELRPPTWESSVARRTDGLKEPKIHTIMEPASVGCLRWCLFCCLFVVLFIIYNVFLYVFLPSKESRNMFCIQLAFRSVCFFPVSSREDIRAVSWVCRTTKNGQVQLHCFGMTCFFVFFVDHVCSFLGATQCFLILSDDQA